eukprot:4803300-Prymnesium_polylepis.2
MPTTHPAVRNPSSARDEPDFAAGYMQSQEGRQEGTLRAARVRPMTWERLTTRRTATLQCKDGGSARDNISEQRMSYGSPGSRQPFGLVSTRQRNRLHACLTFGCRIRCRAPPVLWQERTRAHGAPVSFVYHGKIRHLHNK